MPKKLLKHSTLTALREPQRTMYELMNKQATDTETSFTALFADGWKGESADTFSTLLTSVLSFQRKSAQLLADWDAAFGDVLNEADYTSAAINSKLLSAFDGTGFKGGTTHIAVNEQLYGEVEGAATDAWTALEDAKAYLGYAKTAAGMASVGVDTSSIANLMMSIEECQKGYQDFLGRFRDVQTTVQGFELNTERKLTGATLTLQNSVDSLAVERTAVYENIKANEPIGSAIYLGVAVPDMNARMPFDTTAEDDSHLSIILLYSSEPEKTLFLTYMEQVKFDTDPTLSRFGMGLMGYEADDGTLIPTAMDPTVYFCLGDPRHDGVLVTNTYGEQKIDVKGWYLALFHEVGHAADYLAPPNDPFSPNTSPNSQNAGLQDTIRSDVKDYLTEIASGFIGNFTQAQIEQAVNDTMNGVEHVPWYEDMSKEGRLLRRLQNAVSQDLTVYSFWDNSSGNFGDLRLSVVSDIFGGATGNTCAGAHRHQTKLWQQQPDSIATEMFAESFAHNLLSLDEGEAVTKSFLHDSSVQYEAIVNGLEAVTVPRTQEVS